MDKKGFSLIEVILVILVVGISSLGLAAAMQQALATIHKPQIISTATALAEKEAERIIVLRFSALANEPLTSYPGDFSAYSRETILTNLDANDKIVTIKVYHLGIGYVWLAFLKTNY